MNPNIGILTKLVPFTITTTPEPDPSERGVAFEIRIGHDEPEVGVKVRVKVTKAGTRGEPGEYE